MVTVEEIADPLPSQERLWDAEEIEQVAASMKRPTARMHLESLAKKLRKESDALKRVERSKEQKGSEEKKEEESAAPAPAISPPAASAATATTKQDPPAAPPAAEEKKQPVASPPVVSNSVKYVPIDRFAFDAGGYNAPFVTLYIELPAVGSIPRENIECNFTKESFDLIVKDLRGKSYRLFKDQLEKDIDPEKSKIVVKADKILVKLAKVNKSEYGGYDYWSKLTDTKKKEEKDDPSKSIMGLMKQMYDEGDDQMKKMIGETMMKQRNGELGKGPGNDMMNDDFGGM